MTTSVVTGAAGFVGSHLSEKLVKDGHEVIGIDNFSDFYPRETKLANLSNLLREKRFKLVEGDISSVDFLELVGRADLLFHLAAQPGVRTSWGESFSVYLKDNILATQRLLEASRNSRIGRFVFASSSSVYGDAERHPTGESSPTRPNSPYGVTKLAAESLCRVYHENFGVPIVILRYFTVYGPRQRPDMAFSRFIDRMRKGKPIELFGDRNQERDFTFVGDTAKATVLASQAPVGETYNVGTGRSVPLSLVISLLEQIIGKKAKVRIGAAARGDVTKTFADISKIREAVGYLPTTRLEDGLRLQVQSSQD